MCRVRRARGLRLLPATTRRRKGDGDLGRSRRSRGSAWSPRDTNSIEDGEGGLKSSGDGRRSDLVVHDDEEGDGATHASVVDARRREPEARDTSSRWVVVRPVAVEGDCGGDILEPVPIFSVRPEDKPSVQRNERRGSERADVVDDALGTSGIVGLDLQRHPFSLSRESARRTGRVS
jgi:hypothetical protein